MIRIAGVSIRNARKEGEVEDESDVKEIEEWSALSFCAQRETHSDVLAIQARVSPNPDS
jgi:hypothetical protein